MSGAEKKTYEVLRTGFITGAYYVEGQEIFLTPAQAKYLVLSNRVKEKKKETRLKKRKDVEVVD